MICKNGCRECDGCGGCFDAKPQEIAGHCVQCGDEIFKWEDHFDFGDGALVHDDCMIDFVTDHYLIHGES